MVKIHRIWFNADKVNREDHYKNALFSGPRVSMWTSTFGISSKIPIVRPHKLMRSKKHVGIC